MQMHCVSIKQPWSGISKSRVSMKYEENKIIYYWCPQEHVCTKNMRIAQQKKRKAINNKLNYKMKPIRKSENIDKGP